MYQLANRQKLDRMLEKVGTQTNPQEQNSQGDDNRLLDQTIIGVLFYRTNQDCHSKNLF